MFHTNATQANKKREKEREREQFVTVAMANVIKEEVRRECANQHSEEEAYRKLRCV